MQMQIIDFNKVSQYYFIVSHEIYSYFANCTEVSIRNKKEFKNNSMFGKLLK